MTEPSDYVLFPEIIDPVERERAMREWTAEVTLAARRALPDKTLWSYCPGCDSEDAHDAWFIVTMNGPLVDAEGVPRCPDCRTELEQVPEQVIDRFLEESHEQP